MMAKKLAIRGLRKRIGSMEYIHSLLITEDDLDQDIRFLAAGTSEEVHEQQQDEGSQSNQRQGASLSTQSEVFLEWCVCSYCRPMPQDIENKRCKLKKCITLSPRSPMCLNCMYVIQVI